MYIRSGLWIFRCLDNLENGNDSVKRIVNIYNIIFHWWWDGLNSSFPLHSSQSAELMSVFWYLVSMCRFMVHDKIVCRCIKTSFFFHYQSNWNPTESKSNWIQHTAHTSSAHSYRQFCFCTDRRKQNLSNRCKNQINFSLSETISMYTIYKCSMLILCTHATNCRWTSSTFRAGMTIYIHISLSSSKLKIIIM